MAIAPWKVIDSRYLIRDPWMVLRADRCETANGVTVDPYYVQEPRDWVQIVAFDGEDRILITRQYRHGGALICDELPCGNVENGETVIGSARRELLEETGCVVDSLRLLSVLSPNPARYANKLHILIATGTNRIQEQSLDDTEEIEFSFLPIAGVLSLIDSGTFCQALHITGLFLALRARQMFVISGP